MLHGMQKVDPAMFAAGHRAGARWTVGSSRFCGPVPFIMTVTSDADPCAGW